MRISGHDQGTLFPRQLGWPLWLHSAGRCGADLSAMGFVTWLNGPLISFVRVAFSLSEFSAFFIPLTFYFSFFLFSVPTSLIARKLGLKTGLTLSLLISALGVAAFGQFVAWRLYAGALTGLLILGLVFP